MNCIQPNFVAVGNNRYVNVNNIKEYTKDQNLNIDSVTLYTKDPVNGSDYEKIYVDPCDYDRDQRERILGLYA